MLDSYRDVTTEIELSKIRIQGLQEEQESIRKLMFAARPYEISGIAYSDMPGGSKDYTSFDRLWERLRILDNEIKIENERIKIKDKTRNKMDKALEDLQALEYKVTYLRLRGYKLKDIASELGYDYDYIRHIAAASKNRIAQPCE